MVNLLNDMLTDLRNAVSKKEIPENENYNKVIGIVKKSSALINNKKIRESKYAHPQKCFKDYQLLLDKKTY